MIEIVLISIAILLLVLQFLEYKFDFVSNWIVGRRGKNLFKDFYIDITENEDGDYKHN